MLENINFKAVLTVYVIPHAAKNLAFYYFT